MKSRLAILCMLVAGMLLSTTGAGLAVTSLGNNASLSQYGPSGGDQGANGGGGGTKNGGDNGDVLGAGGQGGQAPAASSGSGVQPARQVETGAGSGQLPFTGFLAIPVLLGGVALLSTGIILRRRTAGERN